jgi:hypothetical protein
MTPADIEAAAPEQTREVLEALWYELREPKPEIWAVPYETPTPEYEAWNAKGWRFGDFLEAEAYVDAALMLVPEGWDYTLGREGDAHWAALFPVGHRGDPDDEILCSGTTPALALAAAIRKARSRDDG